MKKISSLILLFAMISAAWCGETGNSFSPETDQSRTLGSAETRWGTVYTTEISDGHGNTVNVAEQAEKNHNTLTSASRAAANAHPMSAITGLSTALQPATSISNGLMTAGDKDRLDNLDAEFLPKSGGIMTGALTLAADPVNAREAVTKQYVDNMDATLGGRVNSVEATANNSIQYDDDGGVTFRAGMDIRTSIPQPDDPEGNPVYPLQRTVLDTDSNGNLLLGHADGQVNIDASARPTVTVGVSEPENIAFQSDFAAYATQAHVDEAVAYKADLVDGVIPTGQLPPGITPPRLWPVADSADLVTLTAAIVNDEAVVTSTDPKQVFKLTSLPPTASANWTDISGTGSVVSVNGQKGAVEIDLPNLPAVRNALADTASAADLAGKANLASATFTGPVYFPAAPANATGTQGINADALRTAMTGNLSTAIPLVNGTATAGTSTKVAREGHVHPTATARAAAAVTITANNGLTGGGSLAANRTISGVAATAATAMAAGGLGMVQYAPDNAATTVRNQAVTPAGLAAAISVNGTNIDYSLDEQDTGIKWHNGKQIFRKLIISTTKPTSGYVLLTSVDELIKTEGLGCNTYGRYHAFPSNFYSASTNNLNFYPSKDEAGTVVMIYGATNNSWRVDSYSIVLYYTKL